MTTTHAPRRRHDHHHQVLKHKEKTYGNPPLLFQDFHYNFTNNLTSVPLNFSVIELDEIQVLSTNTSDTTPNIIAVLMNHSHEENISNNTNSTNNPVNVKLLYSLVVPPMLFFCALTILVNLVIVISARWCRKPMSPTLYFSISLALADAYTSLILGTGLLINSYLPKVYEITTISDCLSLTIEGFRLGGILVTVTHLLALAINHWIGIVRPLHYAATMTRRTAWAIILGSWICPILIIFIYFSSQRGSGFLSEHCKQWQFLQLRTFRSVFSIFFFIPLLLMSIIYIHIFFIVRSHHNQRLRYQSCQQLRRNVKAVVTTVLILGTYILGWMPAILLSIIVCNDCLVNMEQVDYTVRYPIFIVGNILLILKALVDPIIYAARMADIKLALKKMRYELFSKCCGACMPPSPTPDPLERGSSRYERSMNETKSLRMSSFGSGSSTRRTMATTMNSNSPPVTSRRHVNSNSFVRGNSRVGNGNLTKLEMTEMNQ